LVIIFLKIKETMRHLITYIFILILGLSAYSQEDTKSFRAGLMFGLVGSQIDGDQNAGYNKAGVSAGIYSRFYLDEQWYFQTEIKYLQKGSRLADNKTRRYFKIKLNYIDLAFLPHFKYNKKWTFGAGFSYSYLIGAYMADSYGEVPLDKYSFYLSDYNIIGKTNYTLNDHWWLEARMSYSLWYITEHPRQFNNFITLHLGYLF